MKNSNNTCDWPGNDPLMRKYHDEEWGVPVREDRTIFEFLVLESAQAGLSWKTILHKREGYRRLFANFYPEKISHFDEENIKALLQDPAIIRNRLKIAATITNAKRFLEVQQAFGSFSTYMWSFVQNKQLDGKRKTLQDIPAVTPEAEAFAKDLKNRCFSFLGPTVVYAHMQAVGMVNDHLVSCFRYKAVQRR